MDPDVGIPVKHNIPLRVLRELALHLDTGTEHTWESLAEYMNLDTVTISWIKSRSPRDGYTRCLLDEYGGRVTVEQLIFWLEQIGNLAARDVLRSEYDNICYTYHTYLDRFRHCSARPEPVTAEVVPKMPLCAGDKAPSQAGIKEGNLTVFLSCSDDGLSKCREIYNWLMKNGLKVVFDDEGTNLFSWAESQVKQAEFVVFVISNGFCRDVQSSTRPSPDCQAVTRCVYDLMHSEYTHNGCYHCRSIPVLLPGTDCANVPVWLKNTHLYVWPKQYKKLFKIFYKHIKQWRYRAP